MGKYYMKNSLKEVEKLRKNNAWDERTGGKRQADKETRMCKIGSSIYNLHYKDLITITYRDIYEEREQERKEKEEDTLGHALNECAGIVDKVVGGGES